MDQGPLVKEQIDAGMELAKAFDTAFPVRNAFWYKEADDGQWYLQLASDSITDSNTRSAYGEVVKQYQARELPWLDLFQVKVSGEDDEIAQAVVEIHNRHGSRLPKRVQSRRIKDRFFNELYIYADNQIHTQPTQA